MPTRKAGLKTLATTTTQPHVTRAASRTAHNGNGTARTVFGSASGDNPQGATQSAVAADGGARGGANTYGAFSVEAFAELCHFSDLLDRSGRDTRVGIQSSEAQRDPAR